MEPEHIKISFTFLMQVMLFISSGSIVFCAGLLWKTYNTTKETKSLVNHQKNTISDHDILIRQQAELIKNLQKSLDNCQDRLNWLERNVVTQELIKRVELFLDAHPPGDRDGKLSEAIKFAREEEKK